MTIKLNVSPDPNSPETQYGRLAVLIRSSDSIKCVFERRSLWMCFLVGKALLRSKLIVGYSVRGVR